MLRTVILLSFLLACYSTSAQNGLRFRYLGFSGPAGDATTNCITPDSRGFLWYYNSTGLHRYDGNRHLTFDLISKPALQNLALTFLFADKQDRLWIGSQSGVSRFDLRTWTITHLKQPGKASSYVTTIRQGSSGDIFIGTNSANIFRVSEDSLVLVASLNSTGKLQSQVSVQSIDETPAGEIWALYEGKMAMIRNGAKQQIDYYPISNFPQELISPDLRFLPDGRILLVSEGKGFFEFNRNNRQLTTIDCPVPVTRFKGTRTFLLPISETITGVLLGSGDFFLYDASSRRCTDSMPYISEQIRRFNITYMSSRGNIQYLTTDKGMIELQPQPTLFRNLLRQSGANPAQHSIRSIYKHSDGQLFAGSYRAGLIRIDERSGAYTQVSDDYVYAFLPMGPDRILLATEGRALQWFTPTTGHIQPFYADTVLTPRKDQMRKKYIISLSRENDSVVWAGTYHGAFRINLENGHSIFVDGKGEAASLQDSRVMDILLHNNKVYFATSSGIFVLDRTTNLISNLLQSSPDKASISCYTIRFHEGRFLAGTNGRGIYVISENGELEKEINYNNGLAGNSVYFLQKDKQYLLAGTDRGLSLIDLPSGTINSFNRQHNLPSQEFNHSASFAADGKFYFGTINGITVFDEGSLSKAINNYPAPELPIASFTWADQDGVHEFFNTGYLAEPSLEMGSGTHYFSLQFGGIGEELDQLQYFYRLSTNGNWLETGQDRKLSFAGIAPGSYRLELGFKRPGDKSLTIVPAIPLVLHAAFYQTWWFISICVLLAATLVLLLVRYRLKQLLREQELRTRIAGDLHDEVGSSLTRIWFQADLLMIQKGEEESLQRIATASRDALGIMSDMVWSIDARFDTMEELVSRIKDYLNKLKEELDIQCIFILQGDSRNKPVSQMIRQNFLRIFKEALNNAVRYGSEPIVKVEMDLNGGLSLRISNPINRQTITLKQYQGKQGSHYMQERAARMGGVLTRTEDNGEYILHLIIPNKNS